MASRRKIKSEGIVRRFVVKETKLHEKGYTVYKVVQQVIPVDKTDGQIFELVVWHRYSEFKKLYQATKHLHALLHRKEEFPSFAEAKVFGRFEKAVIEDRMKSANELLNFIGERVYLVKSKAFEDFFSGASVTDVSERAEVLQPDLVSLNTETNIFDEQNVVDTDDVNDAVPGNESVWNWLKIDEEEMSVCSDDHEISSESANASEISAFDPFSAAENDQRKPRDNLAMLSELCVEPVPAAVDSTDSGDAAAAAAASPSDESSSIPSPITISDIVADETSVDIMDNQSSNVSVPAVALSTADTASLPTPVPASTAQYLKELDPISSPKHSPGQVKRVSRAERSDYIYQAATQFSLAQQCEANENYHMAFNYYKSGVGILLTGVQKDESEERREVVRRKTAKYLLKAEQLYANYLNTATSHDKMYNWDTGKPSPAKELEPEAAFIQGAPSELRRYSVLGLIADRHMLVVDNITGATCVLKVLLKSAVARSPLYPNIIPTSCAFMVKLLRFYELENAIYLLLEYISGGTLWSLVSSYLRTDESPWQPEGKQRDLRIEIDAAAAASKDKREPSVAVVSAGVSFTRNIDDNKVADSQPDLPRVNASDNSSGQHDMRSKVAQKRVSFDENPVSSQLTVNCHSEFQHGNCMDQSLTDPQSPDSFSRESSSEPDRLTMSPQVHDLREGPDFCHVLGQVHRSLDNFSICSFDSGDGVPTLVSKSESVAGTIDTIEEDVEHSGTAAGSPTVGTQSTDVAGSKAACQCGDKCEGTCTEPNSIEPENETSLGRRKEARSVSCDSYGSDVFSDNRAMLIDSSSAAAVNFENSTNTAFLTSSCDSADTIRNVAEGIITSNLGIDKSVVGSDSVALSTSENMDKQMTRRPIGEREDHVTLKTCRSEGNLPAVDQRTAGGVTRPRLHRLSSAFDELDLAGGNQRVASLLPEDCVRRWAAELVSAVSYLHTLGLLVLDLRPANVLLTDRGHIRLTYMSQWSTVTPRLCVEARDNMYMAPEICDVNEPTEAADWWSVGALLYELLTGKSVIYNHPAGLTAHRNLSLPEQLSAEAKSLLTQLLAFNPSERLGAGPMGADDIRAHPFFVGVDWRLVNN